MKPLRQYDQWKEALIVTLSQMKLTCATTTRGRRFRQDVPANYFFPLSHRTTALSVFSFRRSERFRQELFTSTAKKEKEQKTPLLAIADSDRRVLNILQRLGV